MEKGSIQQEIQQILLQLEQKTEVLQKQNYVIDKLNNTTHIDGINQLDLVKQTLIDYILKDIGMEEISQLKQIYSMIDNVKTGSITWQQIQQFMQEINKKYFLIDPTRIEELLVLLLQQDQQQSDARDRNGYVYKARLMKVLSKYESQWLGQSQIEVGNSDGKGMKRWQTQGGLDSDEDFYCSVFEDQQSFKQMVRLIEVDFVDELKRLLYQGQRYNDSNVNGSQDEYINKMVHDLQKNIESVDQMYQKVVGSIQGFRQKEELSQSKIQMQEIQLKNLKMTQEQYEIEYKLQSQQYNKLIDKIHSLQEIETKYKDSINTIIQLESKIQTLEMQNNEQQKKIKKMDEDHDIKKYQKLQKEMQEQLEQMEKQQTNQSQQIRQNREQYLNDQLRIMDKKYEQVAKECMGLIEQYNVQKETNLRNTQIIQQKDTQIQNYIIEIQELKQQKNELKEYVESMNALQTSPYINLKDQCMDHSQAYQYQNDNILEYSMIRQSLFTTADKKRGLVQNDGQDDFSQFDFNNIGKIEKSVKKQVRIMEPDNNRGKDQSATVQKSFQDVNIDYYQPQKFIIQSSQLMVNRRNQYFNNRFFIKETTLYKKKQSSQKKQKFKEIFN